MALSQTDILAQCRREDATALRLCGLGAADDLLLYFRGLRRRGLDKDEYDWLCERLAELRRSVLRLEGMIDREGGR